METKFVERKTEFCVFNDRMDLNDLSDHKECLSTSILSLWCTEVSRPIHNCFFKISIIIDYIPPCIESLVLNKMQYVFLCKNKNKKWLSCNKLNSNIILNLELINIKIEILTILN